MLAIEYYGSLNHFAMFYSLVYISYLQYHIKAYEKIGMSGQSNFEIPLERDKRNQKFLLPIYHLSHLFGTFFQEQKLFLHHNMDLKGKKKHYN